jgi:hypothetical protein
MKQLLRQFHMIVISKFEFISFHLLHFLFGMSQCFCRHLFIYTHLFLAAHYRFIMMHYIELSILSAVVLLTLHNAGLGGSGRHALLGTGAMAQTP